MPSFCRIQEMLVCLPPGWTLATGRDRLAGTLSGMAGIGHQGQEWQGTKCHGYRT